MLPEGWAWAPQSSDQFYWSPVLDVYFLAMLAAELLESIKKEVVKKKKNITESLIPQKLKKITI